MDISTLKVRAAHDLVKAYRDAYEEDKTIIDTLTVGEFVELLFDENSDYYGYTHDARRVLCGDQWILEPGFYEIICDDKELLEFFLPDILVLCETRYNEPQKFFETVYKRIALDNGVLDVLRTFKFYLMNKRSYRIKLEQL